MTRGPGKPRIWENWSGVYNGLIKRRVQVESYLESLMAPRPSYARWLLRESQLKP